MLILVALALFAIPAVLFLLANIFLVLGFISGNRDSQIFNYVQSVALFVAAFAWVFVVSIILLMAGAGSFLVGILPYMQ